QDPIALLETKWLKDGRHHNDKGAWILKLREVGKGYPTVRGLIAILLGYWQGKIFTWLVTEGGVKSILVATDEQVYTSLQPYLDDYLDDQTYSLIAEEMRKSYTRPNDLAKMLINLYETNRLDSVAKTWFEFVEVEEGKQTTGEDRVKTAID